MSTLRQQLQSDRSLLAQRYPVFLRGDLKSRFGTIALLAGGAALLAFALVRFDFSFERLGTGLQSLRKYLSLMWPPSSGTQFNQFMTGLRETLSIAFLGTLLAALAALPLGLMAANNVLPAFLARFLVRRSMDTLRSIDTLIWALIWINVVGLGPFAGILAIATTDVGSLGKLFSEALENADQKQEEGIAASGGGFLQRIRFGIFPETMPVMVSQVLYYMESNTRSATIVGIVGAGGLGVYMTESIRVLEWEKVSYLIILILITVTCIDFVSSRLRLAMIGTKQAPI